MATSSIFTTPQFNTEKAAASLIDAIERSEADAKSGTAPSYREVPARFVGRGESVDRILRGLIRRG